MLVLAMNCSCTDFAQLMHHDAFGRDLCTCGLHFIGQSEILGREKSRHQRIKNQRRYECLADTSSFKFRRSKRSIGHAFTVRICTENQNQTSFYPSVPHEISVLVELILGHLRYLLTDVPPQPNSQPDNVLRQHSDRAGWTLGRARSRQSSVATEIGVESSFMGNKEGSDARPLDAGNSWRSAQSGERCVLVRISVGESGTVTGRADGPGAGRFDQMGLSLGTGSGQASRDGRPDPWMMDQAGRTLGRYVATELWVELGRYVATDLWVKLGRYVATELWLELSRYSDEQFARQYRCGPPPEFPLASPRSGLVHHLSGPDRHDHTRTILRRSRSVGCAPVRDPANQLPCALRVYLHTCQTPWSVFQDGSNGEPTGRLPEHADAEARREARAADHD
ncbi:unnamed protein product [Brassica rapa subsp. trilocularis]